MLGKKNSEGMRSSGYECLWTPYYTAVTTSAPATVFNRRSNCTCNNGSSSYIPEVSTATITTSRTTAPAAAFTITAAGTIAPAAAVAATDIITTAPAASVIVTTTAGQG